VPSNVKCSFESNLCLDEIACKIKQLNNPQVVLWYFGTHGLKVDCIKFYRPFLTQVSQGDKSAACYLFDLTAWSALQNKTGKIDSCSSAAKKVDQLQLINIKPLYSSEIFQKMINERTTLAQYYKKEIAQRTFLYDASRSFKNTDIMVGEVFKRQCPILETLYDLDTSKSYSVIQYLEGCYITADLVEKALSVPGDINIVFALPNDEEKYYGKDQGVFAKDCAIHLQELFGDRIAQRNVNIHFLNFSYGETPSDRPYNAGTLVSKSIDESQIREIPVPSAPSISFAAHRSTHLFV
jgi:hypothetical protein